MKRTVFKWTLGISIAVLIGVLALMLFIYAAGGVLMLAMLSAGSDTEINMDVTIVEFYADFVGSPLFYIAVTAGIVLVGSIVGLILTKKAK